MFFFSLSREKDAFRKEISKMHKGQKVLPMKRVLYKLSNRYQVENLLDSYYFKDVM